MKTIYRCELCKTDFDTAKTALACENRKKEKLIANVGDIVFVKSGFGWFDGDKVWISNPDVMLKRSFEYKKCPNGDSNCFGECCTYRFFYVVTAIDFEGHRARYHCATLAMTGIKGYASGYTFGSHHYTLVLVKNPPAKVIKASKALIGTRATNLI